MRQSHCIVTSADVKTRASFELSQVLPWVAVGPLCPVEFTLRILWMLATLKTSLHALVSRFKLPYSETYLRRSLFRQLSDPAALAKAFSQRFRTLIPKPSRKGFIVAIDTHWSCYYGDRLTPGIVHGQRKNSTRRFFMYATAVIVEKGRRYTLALTQPESNRPLDALQPLLDQIAASGIPVRSLLLDKAFFAADVFALLQSRGITHIVAVPHRRSHLRRLLRGRKTCSYNLTRRHRKGEPPLMVKLQVVRVKLTNDDKSVSTHLYAFSGVPPKGDIGETCRRSYRSRFGIETSYRQLNQAKGRTTSRDPRWRLLLVGMSLLLRQIWVFLENAARTVSGQRHQPETVLERLCAQIAIVLTADLPDKTEILLGKDDARFFKTVD